jgi:hypothetical protein
MQLAKRLTDAEKKKIIADYVINQNYSETARLNNCSDKQVKRIIVANEEVAKKVEIKSEENTANMLEYFVSQQTTKGRILNKLLKAIEQKSEDADINTLKELATAYGIIMDKELKIMEMQRGNGSREDIMKVEELLEKIKDEAYK